MESALEAGPALFAGLVCALFGLSLLVWTTSRLLHGGPVAVVARPAVAAVLTGACGAAFLAAGLWLLTSL